MCLFCCFCPSIRAAFFFLWILRRICPADIERQVFPTLLRRHHFHRLDSPLHAPDSSPGIPVQRGLELAGGASVRKSGHYAGNFPMPSPDARVLGSTFDLSVVLPQTARRVYGAPNVRTAGTETVSKNVHEPRLRTHLGWIAFCFFFLHRLFFFFCLVCFSVVALDLMQTAFENACVEKGSDICFCLRRNRIERVHIAP